jgi:hypothetical protein
LIGVNLPVFCPAPQSAVADFQFGTGRGVPRASGDGGDGVVDQSIRLDQASLITQFRFALMRAWIQV